MGLCFQSCGDDEEETTPSGVINNGGSNSNLSSEARFFVGNWAIASGANTYYWTFYANGECDYVYMTSQEHGQWSYTTGLLSTTVSFWTFYIDATFDGAWTGTAKGSGSSVRATKLADDDVATNHLQQPTPKPDTRQTCYSCKGSGNCNSCNGGGLCYYCKGSGQGYYGGMTCPVCNGKKMCNYCSGSGTCSTCKGKGYTESIYPDAFY